MKKILTYLAVAAFALTFGVAFADEMPGTRAFDTGAYYGRALTGLEMGVKGAAPGGIREDVLYKSESALGSLFFGAPAESIDLPDPYRGFLKVENKRWSEAKGAAPGGIRSEIHDVSIIDTLSPTGVRREVGGEGKTWFDE